MPVYNQDTTGSSIPNWGPASKLVAIVKSDDTDLTTSGIRSLYVGGTGDVVVIALNDTAAITFEDVPVGTILPVMVKKVMAATTATLLVGMA